MGSGWWLVRADPPLREDDKRGRERGDSAFPIWARIALQWKGFGRGHVSFATNSLKYREVVAIVLDADENHTST